MIGNPDPLLLCDIIVKKTGHVTSDFWLLKKSLCFGKSNRRSNPTRAELSIGLDKSEIIREEFKHFVSEGLCP